VEVLHGLSNWKLTLRQEEDHIVILRAQTCDERAILPDELFGLPVTVLGDHALSPDAFPLAGEELRIICGREGEWNNRNIRDLTMPEHLKEVRDYALYGCRSLKTLRLHDRADHWGGGCLVNCRSLEEIHLHRVAEKQGEALAFLCGEIHEELTVTVYGTDGSVTKLLFPGYSEDYEENFANHYFDYSIAGGGFTYHNIFRRKQLDLKDYDGLWAKYMREQYEEDAAVRLAYMRLRWPVELEESARAQYTAYLRDNAEHALLWQLSQRDAQGLLMLLDTLQPEESVLHRVCQQARQDRNTEALALLLEKQRKSGRRGLERNFDL